MSLHKHLPYGTQQDLNNDFEPKNERFFNSACATANMQRAKTNLSVPHGGNNWNTAVYIEITTTYESS